MTPANTRRFGLKRLCLPIAAVALAALTACSPVTPITDYRGYLPRPEEIQKVQVGMSKAEVQALLGSPSSTAPSASYA